MDKSFGSFLETAKDLAELRLPPSVSDAVLVIQNTMQATKKAFRDQNKEHHALLYIDRLGPEFKRPGVSICWVPDERKTFGYEAKAVIHVTEIDPYTSDVMLLAMRLNISHPLATVRYRRYCKDDYRNLSRAAATQAASHGITLHNMQDIGQYVIAYLMKIQETP